MVRTEFIIGGCLLAGVGVFLAILGYQDLQPTTVDQIVSFAAELTGEKIPVESQHTSERGYLLLAAGGIAFLAGVLLILNSRMPQPDRPSSTT